MGGVPVPPGLMEGRSARWASGRDSSNNVLVYWSEDSLERPSGGAGCWLFDSSSRSWSANRGLPGPPSSPFPGWVCGSPRRPGPDLALFSAAAACSGGRLEVLDEIFSTGWAECPASWGWGMPRYFRRGGAAASRGFGWFRGLFSGPPEGLVCPSARTLPPVLLRGRGAACRAVRKSGPEGGFFAPSAPAFSGPEGGVGDPGRGDFSPDREKRTCAKKVRGGIQLRVVGSARLDLCNERSFRTDVSICTIFRYDSARASVQEKCPAVGEGVQGGSLSKKLSLNYL